MNFKNRSYSETIPFMVEIRRDQSLIIKPWDKNHNFGLKKLKTINLGWFGFIYKQELLSSVNFM